MQPTAPERNRAYLATDDVLEPLLDIFHDDRRR